MYPKTLSAALMALAAARMASAQTFTDCDPLEKECKPDEAFGKNGVNCDWTKGECKDFEPLPGTTVNYNDAGAVFSIEKVTNAPTMATHKRIFFGRVDVELIAAPGQGVVTSVVFESADLDEIDWEWVGGDTQKVQTNYFGKGDTTTYDRGAYHPVADPLTTVHKYSIDWTKDRINWEIDGAIVRTLTYDEAKGGSRYPQTPMEIKIGTWVAGRPDAPQGTVDWAGGYTDFSKGPYDAFYKSISIVDYAGGDAPTKDDIKEYVWTDKTGSWESIKVVKGDGSSDEEEAETTSSSAIKTVVSKTKSHVAPTTTITTPEAVSTKSTSTKTVTSVSVTPTPTEDATTTSSADETEEETSSTSAEASASETADPADNDNAAAGVLAHFGRVALAGAAAVAVAQLL